MKTKLNIILSIALIFCIVMSSSIHSLAVGDVDSNIKVDGKLTIHHTACFQNPYQDEINKRTDIINELSDSIEPIGTFQSIIFRVVGLSLINIIAELKLYYL